MSRLRVQVVGPPLGRHPQQLRRGLPILQAKTRTAEARETITIGVRSKTLARSSGLILTEHAVDESIGVFQPRLVLDFATTNQESAEERARIDTTGDQS